MLTARGQDLRATLSPSTTLGARPPVDLIRVEICFVLLHLLQRAPWGSGRLRQLTSPFFLCGSSQQGCLFMHSALLRGGD